MFKIFLWRTIYHLLCLAKALGFKGRGEYYFAYGGNLDPEVLKRRNIEILGQQDYCLQHHCFKFNHEIPFKNAAMASVESCSGDSVMGRVYKIARIDGLRLDCAEACIVFRRYTRKYFKMPNGNRCFFYQTNRPKEGLFPLKYYLEKILNGYRLFPNVDPAFLKKLEATPTIEKFEEKDPPYFLFQNYEILGKSLAPFIIRYDKQCVKIFAKRIFKASPFERFFRS